MTRTLKIEPLTRAAFAPYGDVIEIGADAPGFAINAGTTQRFHDLGTAVATGSGARVVISMARAQPFSLPLEVGMVERHPFGSQCFVPVERVRFVVTVAPDEGGTPGTPRSFLARPGQGINFHRGTWHAPLTALDRVTDFLIVDREGEERNLDEFRFEQPWSIAE